MHNVVKWSIIFYRVNICNKIEITGIPDSVPDQHLEEKVVDILNEISVMYHQKIFKCVIL